MAWSDHPEAFALLVGAVAGAAAARLRTRKAPETPQLELDLGRAPARVRAREALAAIDWSGAPLVFMVLLAASDAGRLWPLVVAVCLVWIMGLALDRWPAPWHWRAAGVAGLAFFVWSSGMTISSVKLPFTETFVLLSPWASALITVVWVAVASLAFSMTGSLRGAVFGVGGVAALAFVAVCLMQPAVTGSAALMLSAGVAGAALGHAVADRSPARAGRAGAMTLGFLLGAVSVMGALKNTAFLIGVLPLLLLGVPLLDLAYARARRDAAGTTAMGIDWRRARLHEVLLARGYLPRQITALFVGGAAFLAVVAVGLVHLVEVSFLVKLAILIATLPAGGLLAFLAARLMPRAEARRPTGGRIEMFDVPIDRVTMDQALDMVEKFVRRGRPHMVITSDASALVRAQEDHELRQIMAEADLVTADGAGIVAAARVLDTPLTQRVSGCDMVDLICERSAAAGYSVFLLGAEPGVADEAAARLCERYPELKIAGLRHGYFTDDEEPAIIEAIRDARPEVLFVALGIPRQEKWIRRHSAELDVPVCLGVGGSFDVISGRVARAPAWMQRAGLEWLYRTLQRPTRWRRLAALPKLGWMTLKELARPRRTQPPASRS